jgi:protein gp37
MHPTDIETGDVMWAVTEGCKNGCPYCFMETYVTRFREGDFSPKMHPERLDEPRRRKKPAKILVSWQSELFGDWIPSEFIQRVIDVVRECPWHTFLFLTKCPSRYRAFTWPDNCWIGTSIENQEAAEKRVPLLLEAKAAVKFLSVEPLLGPVDLTMLARQETNPTWIDGKPAPWTFYDDALTGFKAHKAGGWYGPKVDWVIIGRQTGRRGLPLPDPKWIRSIIDQCNATNVPFYMKKSLADVPGYSLDMLIQQWPKVGGSK